MTHQKTISYVREESDASSSFSPGFVAFPHISQAFPCGKVSFSVAFPAKMLLDWGKWESKHFEPCGTRVPLYNARNTFDIQLNIVVVCLEHDLECSRTHHSHQPLKSS